MVLRKFLLTAFLSAAFQSAGSQALNNLPVSFKHLSVNDGLSQNSVTCIFQDSKNLIWLGTQEGLNSYNGYNFKTYKHNPDNLNSLSSSSILCLTEDNSNTLYIGTDGGGLNLLNQLTGKFSHFEKNDSLKNSISSNRVKDILIDAEGRIWIATFGGGLNYFEKTTDKFYSFFPDSLNKKSFSNFVVKIVEDKKHRLWLTTRNGFFQFNPDQNSFTEINLAVNDSSMLPLRLTDLVKDENGILWIGSANAGIFSYNADSKIAQHYSTSTSPITLIENFVNKLLFDSQNNLWIGYMNSGVNVMDTKTNSIISYESSENNLLSISGNQISSFLEDRSGLLWTGTFGNGVNTADIKMKRLSAFRYHNASRNIKEQLNIYSISEDENNNLFLGTNESGLYVYDSNDSIQSFKESEAKFSIPKNDVWALLKSENQNYLVGTYGKGISNFNLNEKKFTPAFYKTLNDTSRFNAGLILFIFRDKQGLIWIATQRLGLYAYNESTDSLQHFYPDSKTNPISDATALTVYQDSKNKIWIGTFENGIDVLDKNSNTIQHFKKNPADKNSISNNAVTCFYESPDGIMWIGTIGGGINSMQLSTGHITRFTEEQGLPDNTVYGILPDANNNLWLSTNKGICKITQAKNDSILKISCRNFDVSDGLPANEFNLGAYFKNKNGVLYFGSVSGLVSLNPELIKDNTYLPSVLIYDFKVFEKDFPLDTNISYKKVITLNYNQDFFTFEFAGLNYFLPERNQYSYKMEGFDKNWNLVNNRRFAAFTNLSPGTYIFKVKATNNDGVWNNTATEITIIINPPFWMTLWFRLLVIATIILLILLYVNTRIQRIRKEERRKADFAKRIAEVEMKALRAQMNPHFIFNSLNAIHKYVWDRDQVLASDYLSRFSKLMRMILENSQHQKITIDKEIEALKIYLELECLRFNNEFSFEINFNAEYDEEEILIPPLIIQPFVENAILHGLNKKLSGEKKIFVNISTEDKLSEKTIAKSSGFLIVKIIDTGIGREAAAKLGGNKTHQSMGMSVTKDRIEILNAESEIKTEMLITDLKDFTGNVAGTCVELKLPLDVLYS